MYGRSFRWIIYLRSCQWASSYALFLYYYAILACSVYLGEGFPTEIRLRGSGFAHAIGRLAGIISPYAIAFLLQSYGAPAVFLTNGAVLIVLAIIIGFCGEETRGKSLEEINASTSNE